MIRLATFCAAVMSVAACTPSAETLHRRRVAEVVVECIDNARQDLVSPSTFKAQEFSARVIGSPESEALAVRVPISGENRMGARVEAEALCAQRTPGGPVETIVVPR